MKKSCGNCVNVDKVKTEGRPEFWACDEYGFYHLGQPADCTPPNDEACELWTNDPKQANSWLKHI